MITTKNEDVPKLVRGSTVYQIYSSQQYIYYVTASLEKLYRIKFHREADAYVRDEKIVFKRVNEGDTQLQQLRREILVHIPGYSVQHNGIKYEVFQLKDYASRVYVIAPKKMLGSALNDEAGRIYYVFAKKVR